MLLVLYLMLLVSPCYQQWKQRQSIQASLSEKISKQDLQHSLITTVTSSSNSCSDEAVLFLMLLNKTAMQYDVTISSIKRSNAQHIQQSHLLTITLQGHPNNLLSFLIALKPNQHPFTLLDFSFVPKEQSKYVLTLAILLMSTSRLEGPIKTTARSHQAITVTNLFCSRQFSTAHDANLLQSNPLSQIKMIGYLAQGHRHQALVLLHDHLVFSVNEQTILGQERFRIQSITEDRIKLLSPTGEYKTLLLSQIL